MRRRHGFTVIGLVAAATACGGEEIAERFAENRIEAEGGGEVDIDLDGGDFSVKTEDGELSIRTDADGNVSVQGAGENAGESFTIDSENGETVVETEDGTAVYSQGGELPDGFPESIPLPDDLAVLFAQSAESPDGQAYSVAGTSSVAVADLTADTRSGLEAAGYEQQQLTTTPDGSVLVYSGPDHDVMVAIGTGGEGETSITMTVTPGG